MSRRKSIHLFLWPALILTTGIAAATSGRWLPPLRTWVSAALPSEHEGEHDHDHDHDHDHGSSPFAKRRGEDHREHETEDVLELSGPAMRNIGLKSEFIRPVQLQTFYRSITVPAMVTEIPGRTGVKVATPLTGVITQVHVVQGESVVPGTLLFEIRLTHEDLVEAQTEFLKTIGELEVEEREIDRLRDVTRSGAIPGKRLLEREYARDKLAAIRRAQREALLLHGLTEQQVDDIAERRRLLSRLQVFAPSADGSAAPEALSADSPHVPPGTASIESLSVKEGDSLSVEEDDSSAEPALVLQDLSVHLGQSVEAGETLCELADYSELLIEGLAFEQDIHQLRTASARDWTVDAILQGAGDKRVVEGLEIAYLSNRVNAEARTLPFYVRLPNEIAKQRQQSGSRYIEWRYLPGQRLQLRVPVEQWQEQLVLPVEAVADEGAEAYVFRRHGEHFDRVAVHVLYRDQRSAVVAADGPLAPGDVLAMRGAHQMQIAMKNAAGGAVDPHQGHSH